MRPLFLLFAISRAAEVMAAERIEFNRDIRPILSDNCFFCHGPDQNTRKSDLRLDKRDNALTHQAIVPGQPEQSGVIARISTHDAEQLMPPPSSNKKLTARQVELLKQWIAEGAEYQPHWAFVAPLKREPPASDAVTSPPEKTAARNPIDAFVRARLIPAELQPSPEASKETLIRRVTLDLTGLPPTSREVDDFLKDESAGAYETVVDRLLKSPHYGERMAIEWLDAARYADSNGYQVDRDRELWPWRDWVIKAFNDNLPFDQFTVEQLAGDLLPAATLEQRIATGFHRNHMLNEEGGIIGEEFLAEYTADRVETTAAVWLGQTFNCARCHDHKYDPFTQRDFYALKAFFHNVPERGVGDYSSPIRRNAPPFLKLPALEIEAKIATLNAPLKTANERLAALTANVTADLENWAGRAVAENALNWQSVELLAVTGVDSPPSIDSKIGSVEIGPQPPRETTIRLKAKLPAGRWTALRLECATASPEAAVQWSELKVASPQSVKLRGVPVGDSLAVAEAAKLLDNDRKSRTTLMVQATRAAQGVFELETPLMVETPLEIDVELGLESTSGPTRWRLLVSGADQELFVPAAILSIARTESAKRTAAETKQLVEFRLAQQPEQRRLSAEIATLTQQLATAEAEIPTTLIMEELKEPRATFVLMRGAYDKPGEAVTAATPAVLPALADGLPRNRLGLAKWLIDPSHPLTARVTVNRLWQQLFGAGLVRTSEDFGAQGELPSHPELLDWLAVTFREGGWDVKHIMKLIVTSHTYRQQSHVTSVLRERDFDNRLLARGPRQRLLAEFVRDQALAVSGLLVTKLGGPSVRPYHPPGLYEQVTSGSGYNVYVAGSGDDLYRRSLYTYWKRSVPHPAMLLFDAPFRETCSLRRPRSNTPLQALNLLNDPTYVEASRCLAQRMMLEGGDTTDGRLVYGVRLLLARTPHAKELAVLHAAYDRARGEFEKDESAAKALIAVGSSAANTTLNPVELAAFTSVASTLLNLDEAINKE